MTNKTLLNSCESSSMATICTNLGNYTSINKRSPKSNSNSKQKHPRTALQRKKHNYFNSKKNANEAIVLSLSPYVASKNGQTIQGICDIHKNHYKNVGTKVSYSLANTDLVV